MKSTDPSIAGDENPVSDSISFEELIAQRTARASARNAESEATTEEPETSDEEVQDDDEEGYASQEDDARDDEEGSEEVREDEQDGLQVDLLNLSPEQIQELAKSAKSRLLDDLGKTRKENRQIKEELAPLRNTKTTDPMTSSR